MKEYLHNLLRRGLARCPARPPRATRLELETLDKRDVPAVMNLTGYTFALPGATLLVTNENVLTGQFAGTFTDAASGIAISIPMGNGHLQPIGPNLDALVFQGVGMQGLETEKVAFHGDLHEATYPLMIGQLTESYSLPVAQWTVSRIVEGYGVPPPHPFPWGASEAASIDAAFAGSSWNPVAVNPQPLPPFGIL
jgi:hypothetical protein